MVRTVVFLWGTSNSIHQFIFWLPTQLSCCQIVSHIALLNEAKSFGVTKALIEEKQIMINAMAKQRYNQLRTLSKLPILRKCLVLSVRMSNHISLILHFHEWFFTFLLTYDNMCYILKIHTYLTVKALVRKCRGSYQILDILISAPELGVALIQKQLL